MTFNTKCVLATAAAALALMWGSQDVRSETATLKTRNKSRVNILTRTSSHNTAPISITASDTVDQITIKTTALTPKYSITKLQSPSRLVVDIDNERIKAGALSSSSGSRHITGVRVGNHPHKSRIVVDLVNDTGLTHSAEAKDGQIVVSLSAAQGQRTLDGATLIQSVSSVTTAKPGAASRSRLNETTSPQAGLVRRAALQLDESVVVSGNSQTAKIVEPRLPADYEAPHVLPSGKEINTAAVKAEVARQTAATQPVDSASSKNVGRSAITSVSLNQRDGNKAAVVISLQGQTDYGMARTAPSEYVLTIKNSEASELLRKKTLFSSQDKGGIRSVRAVSNGSDTQVRIFTQPSSYLVARKSGEGVVVEEVQDLAQVARDIRAQLDPSAAQAPVATPPQAEASATSAPQELKKSGAKEKGKKKNAQGTQEISEAKPDTTGVETKEDVAKNPEQNQSEKSKASAADSNQTKRSGLQVDKELAALNGHSLTYTGRLISLDLQDADIDSALRIIAEVSGLNIVAGDGVSGKVTLKLVDVPWDQALDVILKSHGLDRVVEGNVMRVAPVDKLQLERESLKKARVAGEELEDLNVKYMRVSYAKASEIKALVETVLSERGSVAFDERSNQLIVKDIRKGLENVGELIKKIDLRTPQILLETQIVEANRNLSRQLGSELGFQYIQSPGTGNGTGLNFPSAISVGGSVDPATQGSITGSAFPAAGVSAAFGSAITMLFDSADGTKSLSTRLSQLEQEGQVRIISKPAVATTNNKPAEIKSVEKFRVKLPNGGLSIATGSGASSNGSGDLATQTIEAGIVLNVTPQASPDYYILLDINAKSSSFGAKSVDGIPNEIERSASSSVLVSSGQTFALGGIYKITEKDDVSGVPFFKDIPILGTFFRSMSNDGSDEELLFFITPRIVEGSFEGASSKVNG